MSFIAELKRRNVIRVAILYAVASWLILQVADVLFGLMSLPDWSLRLVLAILILGFPIALIFSWFYELTPEGLSLEKDVEADQSITHITGRRMNLCTPASRNSWSSPMISGTPPTARKPFGSRPRRLRSSSRYRVQIGSSGEPKRKPKPAPK